MKFLKGFALFILGSLLFLSLFTFGIAFTLNQTILNPEFIVSQVNKLDIPLLAEEMLSQQIPAEAEEFEEYMGEVVTETIDENEQWLKEQASDAAYVLYDYLEGESQSLSLTISLEPVKESLRDNMWQAFSDSLPAELEGLPQTAIEQYFDDYYQPISEGIPSTFELNESSIPTEVRGLLTQTRQIIDYFNLSYAALVGLILLLILLIIIVNRQVRGSTRGIGVNFLTCGAISFIGVFVAERLTTPLLAQANMPPYLQTWLPQLLSDAFTPLKMYSLVLAGVGVVLLIVSFAYKPRQPEF
jgi:hypothetical protein